MAQSVFPTTRAQAAKSDTNGRILGVDVFAILFTLLGFSLGLAALTAAVAHKEELWVQIVSYVAVGAILIQLLVFCVRDRSGYIAVLVFWFLQLGTAIALFVFLTISLVRKDGRADKYTTADKILQFSSHILSILLALIIGGLYRLAHKYDVYG